MPFGFHKKPDHSEKPRAIEGHEAEDVVFELCDRKEMAFMVIPSLSGLVFDSKFLEHIKAGKNGGDAKDGKDAKDTKAGLLIRATMNQSMAQTILQYKDVRLRFPWALRFYSAPCKALEYRTEEKRHTMLVSVPHHLVEDESRASYRVDRVGHSVGVVGTSDMRQLVRVALEEIGTGGMGLFGLEPMKGESFQPGQRLKVDISLEKGPRLEADTQIIHASGQLMGLAFDPPLGDKCLKDLKAWMAPKEEEDLRRWENRTALRIQAEQAAKPKAVPTGVLLITRDEELSWAVSKAIKSIHELRTAAPIVGEVQKQMDPQPLLILLHVPTVTLEERYRLRAFAKSLPSRIPVVVLATGEGDHSQALATELKAGAPLQWKQGTGNVLFQSLVQGLIRQHHAS